MTLTTALLIAVPAMIGIIAIAVCLRSIDRDDDENDPWWR